MQGAYLLPNHSARWALPLVALLMLGMSGAQAQTATVVSDIYAGANGSGPSYITVLGNQLIFRANNGTNGNELWVSDGSDPGTRMVTDLYPGSSSSSPQPNRASWYPGDERFVSNGTYVYMKARNQNYEYVYRTNGSSMQQVTGGGMYSNGPNPHNFAEGPGNRVYWNAHNGSYYYLHYTDSTSATRVSNINSSGNFNAYYFCTIGNRTYFWGNDNSRGYELWYIDGSSSSATLVRDIYSGSSSSSPRYMCEGTNNRVIFSAQDGSNGQELWISDGTSGGTQMLKDIRSGSGSSDPTFMTRLPNGKVLFRADDGTHGNELWVTDGTSSGTMMLKDINPAGNSSIEYPTAVGNKIYFRAYTPNYGHELWESDGTTDGTKLVQDIWPGPNSGEPQGLADINGALYFRAVTQNEGWELWKVLPTGGAQLVADIYPGPNSSNPYYISYLNGYCYFRAQDGQHGEELMKIAIPPEVVSTTPATNSHDAMPSTDITIANSQAVDTTTVSASSFFVSGAFTGTRSGTYSVSNLNAEFDPDADFLPGEIIEVTLSGDFENSFGIKSGAPYVFRFRIGASSGAGQFDAVLLNPIGGASAKTEDVAAGDLDGDGDIDLVFAIRGGQNFIALNDGQGGFATTYAFGGSATESSGVALADMDGDGKLDILIVNYGEENELFLNNGTGGFSTRMGFGPGNDMSTSISVGDMNGDGALDIVVSNFTQQNLVLFNDGAGATAGVTSFGTGFDDTVHVVTADINGDGKLDIVVANQLNPGRYYLNDGRGNFDGVTASRDYGAGVSFASEVAVGDLDNDGDLDIVGANLNRKNQVFWNNGSGEFNATPTSFMPQDATKSVTLIDVNGDDYLDIAFGNSMGQNIIYINDQNGGFNSMPVNFGSGMDDTRSIVAADFTGDGAIDLALANMLGQSVVAPNAMAVNTSPSITSSAPATATVGVRYEYTILATGVPTPTFTASGLPNWLTRNGNVISGTPAEADLGATGVITIDANNGIGTPDIQQFTITVNPAPTAPSFTSTPALNAAVSQQYIYDITTDGFPAATLSVSGEPAWLSLVGNRLTGTPLNSDIGVTSEITLTATNGVDPDATQRFQITVSLVQAPSITSTALTTATVGLQYSYAISYTGAPEPMISASGLPAWLTLSGSTLSGVPAASDVDASGITLTGMITVTANNGVNPQATQSFQITVTDPSKLTPPRVSGAPATVAIVGQEYRTTVQASGSPAPTVMVTGLPDWLSFEESTRIISGTPTNADIGLTEEITIRLENSLGESSEFRYQVLVIELPNFTATSDESTCAMRSGSGSPSAMLFAMLVAIGAVLCLRGVRKFE